MKKASKKRRKWQKRLNGLCFVCWLIIPLAVIAMLVLDGIGLYYFNTERLLVIGVCVLAMLLPFFSEITLKSISFKKKDDDR